MTAKPQRAARARVAAPVVAPAPSQADATMAPSIPAEVISGAQAAQAKWGVPAAVTIAQWADESGYGTHMPAASHNPFGIKAVAGQPFVEAWTTEEIHGHLVHEPQKFRKFASIAAAFDYHGEILHNAKAYGPAMRVKNDPDAFADALTGVYATDHRYGQKLIAIMRANNLYQYDKVPA